MGCRGTGTIRCTDGGSISKNWENTETCMRQLDISKKADCYCYGKGVYFAEAREKAHRFAKCCEGLAHIGSFITCD